MIFEETGGEGSTKKNSKIEEEKYVSTEPDEEKISERKVDISFPFLIFCQILGKLS